MENQIDSDQELLCALSNLKVSLLQNMSQMIYGQTMLLEEIIAAFVSESRMEVKVDCTDRNLSINSLADSGNTLIS